jgi:hypothetical protein
MYKIAALFILTAFGGQASAQDCPDRYRFVDFGLQDREGVIRRGGTIFRAFDGQGAHLLVLGSSICLDVPEVATDGRALPIPVVSSVEIDLEKAPDGLTGLRVKTVKDVAATAQANATRHLAMLSQPGTITTRGESFLCASTVEGPYLSCQLLSPYGGNAPLVVYCDSEVCTMPVLVRDKQLVIEASWPRLELDPEAVSLAISGRVQRIHGFLEAQF